MTNSEAIQKLQQVRNSMPRNAEGDKAAVLLGEAILHLMDGQNAVITLEDAKSLIRAAGGRPCDGACWEDERFVYASSVETVRGTYGHPRFEIQYGKEDGWLSMSDHGPIYLHGHVHDFTLDADDIRRCACGTSR